MPTPSCRVRRLDALYGGGVAIWVVVFAALLKLQRVPAKSLMGSNRALALGGITGLMALGIAWTMVRQQPDDPTTVTDAADGAVERNAYYIIAALFALGSLLSNLDKSRIRSVIPLFMAALFFVVCTVMPPYVVPRSQTDVNLYMQHSAAVTTCYAVGACAMLLASVFVRFRASPA